MERVRSKPVYALLAAAALVTIVVPIGFAGAASDRDPTASTGVKKQVKKLKRQVTQLRQQVEDVTKQPGPQGPEGPPGAAGPAGPATGPAGGDLTGTFPNPAIGPNAVGSDELADDSVVRAKIADAAVASPEILNDSIQSSDLGEDSVGVAELNNVTAVIGPGVTVNAGTPRNAEVICQGSRLIAGGYAWQEDEPNSIIASAPSETVPDRNWVVRGMVDAGSNTLYAWATCMP